MSEFLATLGNALTYGGMVTIIGLLVVFFGLALLIVILMGMAEIFKAIDKRGKSKQQAAQPAAPAPAPAPVPEVAEEEEVVDDTELIAVIAAAIAAYEPDGKKLVVRRVRRVGGWNRAAREEQIGRF